MSDHRLVEDVAQAAAGGASLGGGFFLLRWLITAITGRMDRKQADLDAQDARLDAEWRAIREELKAKIAKMEAAQEVQARQNEALRFAFHHVAAALIKVDPGNPALANAEQRLNQAFPVDFDILAQQAADALDMSEERRLAGQRLAQ